MMPLSIPMPSCRTLASGARQFVVQDPFEIIVSVDCSARWFTP